MNFNYLNKEFNKMNFNYLIKEFNKINLETHCFTKIEKSLSYVYDAISMNENSET